MGGGVGSGGMENGGMEGIGGSEGSRGREGRGGSEGIGGIWGSAQTTLVLSAMRLMTETFMMAEKKF